MAKTEQIVNETLPVEVIHVYSPITTTQVTEAHNEVVGDRNHYVVETMFNRFHQRFLGDITTGYDIQTENGRHTSTVKPLYYNNPATGKVELVGMEVELPRFTRLAYAALVLAGAVAAGAETIGKVPELVVADIPAPFLGGGLVLAANELITHLQGRILHLSSEFMRIPHHEGIGAGTKILEGIEGFVFNIDSFTAANIFPALEARREHRMIHLTPEFARHTRGKQVQIHAEDLKIVVPDTSVVESD